MNLSNRKLIFIQEFLKVDSEQTIAQLERVLRNELEANTPDRLTPFTLEDLKSRVEQSERDFLEGKYKTTEELLKKYE